MRIDSLDPPVCMHRFRIIAWLAVLLITGACDKISGPNANTHTIQLAAPDSSVAVGEQIQVTATVRDQNGREVRRPVQWSSSSTTVATVSATGLVSTLAEGEANITATIENGTSASLTLQIQGMKARVAYGSDVPQSVRRSVQAILSALDSTSAARMATRVPRDSLRPAIVIATNASGEAVLYGRANGGSAEISAEATALALVSMAFGPPFMQPQTAQQIVQLEAEAKQHYLFDDLVALIAQLAASNQSFLDDDRVFSYQNEIVVTVIEDNRPNTPSASRMPASRSVDPDNGQQIGTLPVYLGDDPNSLNVILTNHGYLKYAVTLRDTASDGTFRTDTVLTQRERRWAWSPMPGPIPHKVLGMDGGMMILHVGHNLETGMYRLEVLASAFSGVVSALTGITLSDGQGFALDLIMELMPPDQQRKLAEAPFTEAAASIFTLCLTNIGPCGQRILRRAGKQMTAAAFAKLMAKTTAKMFVAGFEILNTARKSVPALNEWHEVGQQEFTINVCQRDMKLTMCAGDGRFGVTLVGKGTLDGDPISCTFNFVADIRFNNGKFTGVTHGDEQTGCSNVWYWVTVDPEGVTIDGTIVSRGQVEFSWGDVNDGGLFFRGTGQGLTFTGVTPDRWVAGPYDLEWHWSATRTGEIPTPVASQISASRTAASSIGGILVERRDWGGR